MLPWMIPKHINSQSEFIILPTLYGKNYFITPAIFYTK